MGNIKYSVPKKKAVRAFMLAQMPGLHEWWQVLRWKVKDWVWWITQREKFEKLSDRAEMPTHIEIETVNRCNSTCSFCPVNRLVDPRDGARMTEDTFQEIIDELRDWNYTGTLNLFSNNEPFLDKRIFDFIDIARKNLPDAYIQIITNGTLLTPEKAVAALENLTNMVINNYAPTHELHDNLKKVVEHLETNRPDLAAKVTVGYRSTEEVKTNRAGNAPNRNKLPTIFRSRCAYPFVQMVVRPDGKVSMCCNDALGQETLGDVAQDGLRKAWNDPVRKELQELMIAGRHKIDLCATCDNLGWASPRRVARLID
ncbi:MAG: radical SAM protein [Rhodospirillaceae bacterium]|nr:radical SAM protein [Rhodospirillaceae bacterium]